MKHFTLILTALILGYGILLGQTFTQITSGEIVNDGGNSYGIAWGDYDNDGFVDLFVANGGDDDNCLYHNNGDATFTKITSGDIVNDGGWSTAGSWGDYNNDGDLDLFVANDGQNNFLYQNNDDGTFTKITTGIIVNDGGSSFGCSWGDYDNDGDLDLFVANTNNQNNFLYQNNGDGTFTKVISGDIVNNGGDSFGSHWGDYDNDGDLDLFVANGGFNSNQSNFLYSNNGDGTFTRVTSGDIVNDGGYSTGGSWGDYDNDGDLDLFVTNGADSSQNNFLYQNNGDGTFFKITSGDIVNDNRNSWSSSWGDMDNDGDLDLFVTNHIGDFGQNNLLYSNNGDSTFTQITTGHIVNDNDISLGCGWADYDNDGDLDLFVANDNGFDNLFYANDGNSNSWINIKCLGTSSNTSAIGAKVHLKANIYGNAIWQLNEISGQTGGGLGSQNSLSAEFGLGDAAKIDSLVIEWPSGIVQVLENVNVNQFLTWEEDALYLTVNSTGDGGDSNPGDGFCDDGSGDCTLRAAIEEANTGASKDIIAFNIPGPGPHTIQPASALPLIFDPVVIDGTTEPDFAGTPMVELDGSNVSNANGLWFSYGAENSMVRGLVINRFVDEAGIHLGASGGHIIEGNYIGTDVSGTQALGNNIGVWILYLSSNNIIGGTTPRARNLISGNNEAGVVISESVPTNNAVMGNYIGTDVSGTAALGNGTGVLIWNDASYNIIGGDTPEERNIISGNSFGIMIEGSNTTGNQVSGNFIGLDVSGTVAIGSSIGGDGVEINNAPGNLIGGTAAGEGNVLSGNGGSGIWIHGSDATGNLIQGNIIGLDATGAISISNYSTGITIEQAFNNVIGGTDPGSRNIISGNNSDGIDISGSDGTLVQGNFIGTDISGSFPVGNDGAGVYLGNASDNTIGGTEEDAGNLISGNVQSSVIISSGTGNAIMSNLIFSNTGLGIDLAEDGLTPNDPGDGDSGANNLQNFPDINSVEIDGNGDVFVDYSVDSEPWHSAYPLVIQFFESDTPGQGKIFIGEDTYTTTDFNNGGKTITLGNAAGLGISNGDSILATTTDNDGNTSEFSSVDIVTGIDIAKLEDLIPKTFDLAQNYPNPFNPATIIRYDLPKSELVTLKVYDLLGREVETLVNERQTAGSHSVRFNASELASGLYFYKISAGSFNKTRKMVLMR